MKLTIRKNLDYFSPTSFMQACGCELEFYLCRMSGIEIVPMPQNEQMAIGCAFDAFVKSRISELLGKEVYLANLLDTVEPHNAHLIPQAHEIFDKYEEFGCIKRLLDEGIADIELSYRECIGGKIVPGSKSVLGGVVLFGKPDAELRNGTPLDWKTSGYGADNIKSPKVGYTRLVKNGYDSGSHKESRPIEHIDARWATQLTMYKWLKHGLILEPFDAAIEQIIINGGDISVASYRSQISNTFLTELWTRLQETWNRFKEGQFSEPIPSHQLCEPFNNPKPCTAFCPLYKKFLLDPVHSLIRGKR